MNTPIACPCGHQFLVDSQYAGHQVQCPSCSQVLIIPGAQMPTPVQPMSQQPMPGHGNQYGATGPRKPAGSSSGLPRTAVVGIAAGVAVCALVVVIAVIWTTTGSVTDNADNQVGEAEQRTKILNELAKMQKQTEDRLKQQRQQTNNRKKAQQSTTPKVGDPAPEIVGEDIEGVSFKLSDYRGKVVVLDFWGHW